MYKFLIFVLFAKINCFSQEKSNSFIIKKELIEKANSISCLIFPKRTINLYYKAEKLGFVDSYDRIYWAISLSRKGRFNEVSNILLNPDTYYNLVFCDDSIYPNDNKCYSNLILNTKQLKKFRKSEYFLPFLEKINHIEDSIKSIQEFSFYKSIYYKDQEFRSQLLKAETKIVKDSLWKNQLYNDSINRVDVESFFAKVITNNAYPNSYFIMNLQLYFKHQMSYCSYVIDSLQRKNYLYNIPDDFFYSIRHSYLRNNSGKLVEDPYIDFENGFFRSFTKDYLTEFLMDFDNRLKKNTKIKFEFHYNSKSKENIINQRKIKRFFRMLKLEMCTIDIEIIEDVENRSFIYIEK
jgi:hypothetical protein